MQMSVFHDSIKKISMAFILFAGAFATAALLGWAVHAPALTHPFLGTNVMKVNTALSLLILSISFGYLISSREEKLFNYAVKFSALIVAVLTGLTLLEHVSSTDLGIDQLFARDWQSLGWVPGRMCVGTAMSLFFLSLGSLFWNRKSGFVFVCLAGVISSVAVIGYATDCPMLYGSWHNIHPQWIVFNTIAFNTSVSLLSIMLAAASSMPQSPLRKCLEASDAGGYVARMVFPCIIVVPALCAVVAAKCVEIGFFPASVAPSFSIVLAIFGLAAGILKLCSRLSNLDQAAFVNYRARTDVLYSLAHDLRVPIIGTDRILSLMLAENKSLQEMDQRELVHKLKNVQQDMLCMIDNFVFEQKNERKIEKFEPRLWDMNEIIKSTRDHFEEWAKGERVDLKFFVDPHLKLVWCDPCLIKRLVSNLVHNSLKHTSKGGTINIRLSLKESDVLIEVEDNGHGIAPNEVEHVFTRHWQSEVSRFRYQTSNGLGLFICKQIAEQHKGEIICQSEIGKGTTFVITLPSAHVLPLSKVAQQKAMSNANSLPV